MIKLFTVGTSFFFLVCVSCCLLLNKAHAQGFLEMPDTSEVPEYERESMLLDLDVPAVRDRDPDPEAGPRLNVKEFKLQGLVEYPDLGITRAELIKRVEAIRFDLMKEGELTDSGYSLDELGEISDLMADIENETKEQHVGPLEVQKIVFLIREQRRKRGVTLGMVETVADTITRFYRERGFILAKAYIPQQKVRDGVVTLTLLLGELGEVSVENNRRVSERLVRSVFKDDMNKPITSSKIEEALYLVNDIPGVAAQGFFSPGSQVGDSKLSVNVLKERRFSGNLRIDNHGSESTSKNRAYVDFNVHNPFAVGDNLYFGVLKTYNPDSSTYGAFRYSSFVLNPRMRADVGYSSNDFVSKNIIQEDSFITGESQVADASLSYIFRRSRVKNYNIKLSYQDITTQTDTFGTQTPQDVKKVMLSFNFDVLNEKRRQLYAGGVSLAYSNVSGVFLGERVSSDELIFSYDVTALSFFNFPFTKHETRLVLKSAGQYAGEGVSNLNQISLTGPTKTRAFGLNGFQADDGIYLGADWMFTLPKFNGASIFGEQINRIFQPFVYVDTAYGQLSPLSRGQRADTGTLADIGLGLKFNHSNFSGSLLLSKPLKDDVVEQSDETPTSPVYFELQYKF
jgi:hemolysin activation/secretion protein